MKAPRGGSVTGAPTVPAALAGTWPPTGEHWRPTMLAVSTDSAHGGRWTAVRTSQREWLWRHPDPDVARARSLVQPGDDFVDAGGVEECFPTVRGSPDHGAAWSRPWHVAKAHGAGDEHVDVEALRLARRVTVGAEGEVRVKYAVTGPSGACFIHAVHALLDVGPGSVLVVPATPRVQLLDIPREGQTTATSWPATVAGRPLHHLGPDDGTAVAALLLDCRAAVVVDGRDALVMAWRTDSATDAGLCSLLLWRNLRGWPAGKPYRSIGIEPMVGRTATLATLDACAAAEPARLRADGRFGWELTVSSMRRVDVGP
jgi:hypothetical protein